MGGKRVALCITGSVASVKAVEIIRELRRRGIDVEVYVTERALDYVGEKALEWASGKKVIKELSGSSEHLKDFDLVAIAPATANTISKIAHGVADNPVTSLFLSSIGKGSKLLVFPAMDLSLYDNPLTRENLSKLKELGVEVSVTRIEEGKVKIDCDAVIWGVEKGLSEKDLSGIKALVTAGPTREYLDSVRFLTNRSSGKMGCHISRELTKRGAEVTLIYGPGSERPPFDVKLKRVESYDEMRKKVISELERREYDLIFLTAAVSDFKPKMRREGKISSDKAITVELIPNEKIAKLVKEISPNSILVGCKAEYNVSEEELINRAYSRLMEDGMDLIVANDVGKEGRGFEVDTNEVFIIDREKKIKHVPLSPKEIVAKEIIDHVKGYLR